MRSDGVVVDSPALDQDERLLQGVEDFPIEQFVLEMSEYSGRNFLYDSTGIQGKTIQAIGTKTFDPKDLISFLQVLFFSYDMAIVPSGEGDDEVLMIEDVKTARAIINR